MSRKISVTDQAIAAAALNEMADVFDQSGLEETRDFSTFLLDCAAKVRFQPSTRQLVLTFDLDMSGTGADPDGNTRPVGE